MSLFLLLASMLLLLSPALVRRLVIRTTPHGALRTVLFAVVSGALLLETALLLSAAPAVLEAIGISRLATLCHRVAGHLVPGGSVTGWLSLTAATALLVAGAGGWRAARRKVKAVAVSTVGSAYGVLEDVDVVLVDSHRAEAYAEAAPWSRVVISRPMVDVLSEDELEAVLRHELCHLAEGHGRIKAFVAAARCALAWLPGARRSLDVIELLVERVADESAAATGPNARRAVRSALLKVALTPPTPSPALGFNMVGQILIRARALADAEPYAPVASAVVHVTMLGLVAVGALALGLWIGHTHHFAFVAPYCLI